jgi:hypothetical protein
MGRWLEGTAVEGVRLAGVRRRATRLDTSDDGWLLLPLLPGGGAPRR